MPYPNSPFAENFNSKLINSLLVEKSENKKTISNGDLTKTLKWLCSSPQITSIRINTLKTDVEKAFETIKSHYVSLLQPPKIYIHPCLSNTIVIESEDFSAKSLPKFEKEIIVDTECGCAILRGAHIFAPGVLGMVSGCQVDDNVSIYADIAKKCKKGLQKVYVEQKIFIGNGRVKMQRHQLFGENVTSSGVAVEVTETISGCLSISDNVLSLGHGLLQNLPSILCVQALTPLPGDILLDMCASPGNKTTHIAELMKNEGTLIAIDKTPRKVEQLKIRCKDFDAKVFAFQADSTSIVEKEKLSNYRNVTDGPPFSAETFDKILLDAPCSVLGKRPQLANRMSENEIKSYVPLQRKLMEAAVNLLKPGGKMVYSTCTITLAENEGLVAWALRKFSNLELVKPDICLAGPGWIGSTLTEEELKRVQRFGPDDQVDSVGFFYACFLKKI